MKLKVKWGGHRQIVDLSEQSTDSVTLGELKELIRRQLNSDNQHFDLSLNKQDYLQDESQVLSNFGIVSGDLVYVIDSSLEDPPSESSSKSSSSTSAVYQSLENVSSEYNTVNPVAETSSSQTQDYITTEGSEMNLFGSDTTGGGLSPVQADSSQTNKFLREPLVLRESSNTQVSAALNELYNCAECKSASDALWVAVHCLMLESGFHVKGISDECLPTDWRRSGYFRCEYQYPLTSQDIGHCSITGVTLGNTIALHGVAHTEPAFNTETLHLPASQYVRGLNSYIPSVYRSLDRLSLIVKDKICLPLANEISIAAGYRENQGLLSLPREVLLRVVCCLDTQGVSRLSQTCRELNSVCTDKIIWRRLYLQQFREPSDKSLGQDWFRLYKEAFMAKKLREDIHRAHWRNWNEDVWLPRQPPSRHSVVPFPYLLGGRHDLDPQFGFDDFNDPFLRRNTHRLNQNFNARSLGGRRGSHFSQSGNLTGSPFF